MYSFWMWFVVYIVSLHKGYYNLCSVLKDNSKEVNCIMFFLIGYDIRSFSVIYAFLIYPFHLNDKSLFS